MNQVLNHVVIWKLINPADALRFKELLESCAALVPGQLAFEVGLRTEGLEANADVVLVSKFDGLPALQAYQNHPHHQAVSAQLGPLREQRMVVDYWAPIANPRAL